MEFEDIRNAYRDARRQEQKKIVEFLIANGFSLNSETHRETLGNSGQGRSNYTNHNSIKEYNLNNWLWIDAWRDGFGYRIQLQALDLDTNSRNAHHLYDRLSVKRISAKDDKAGEVGVIPNASKEFGIDINQWLASNTGIDLPMNDQKLNELLTIIENL